MSPKTPEEARRQIVTTLKPGREYTLGDIQTLCHLSEKRARGAASDLVEMGILKKTRIGEQHIGAYRLNMPESHSKPPQGGKSGFQAGQGGKTKMAAQEGGK